ncbi:hypothetical protein BDV98DRAFT_572654 [Pterulicium gracile]|uniref:Uncharacterized protein n=1 Tax=Pterulicium gracile TaxID=1884261 RepID=A0A5C3QDB4_9AGAR|nr:hypothetical protein BDV98DRAFT_572654 [Pterula gracilis]
MVKWVDAAFFLLKSSFLRVSDRVFSVSVSDAVLSGIVCMFVSCTSLICVWVEVVVRYTCTM